MPTPKFDRFAIELELSRRGAPRITECKVKPDGERYCVNCRLIEETRERVILYHALEGEWNVDGIRIGPPMFTIAWYWLSRPYNLYAWYDETGNPAASYFNIVDLPGYRRAAEALVYDDLVLDLLIPPDGDPRILDEEELGILSPGQRARAIEALDGLMGELPAVLAETGDAGAALGC